MKKKAKEKNYNADQLYAAYDGDENGKMDRAEFQEFVETACVSTEKSSIDFLFKTIDQQRKGYISIDDFKRIFSDESDEVLNNGFHDKVIVQPEDILLPLYTTILQRMRMSIAAAFEHFKTPGQNTMTYDGLFEMITYFMGIDLLEEEKTGLRLYLDAFGSHSANSGAFRHGEMDRNTFETVFHFKNKHTSADINAANATVKKVKQALKLKGISIRTEAEKYMSPQE